MVKLVTTYVWGDEEHVVYVHSVELLTHKHDAVSFGTAQMNVEDTK